MKRRSNTLDIDLGCSAVCLVLASALALFIVLPNIQDRTERTAATQAWQSAKSLRAAREATFSAEQSELRDLQELVRARLLNHTPQEDWTATVAVISRSAEAAGLEVTSMQPGQPIVSGLFARMPLEINGTGRVDQVAELLAALRSEGVDFRVQSLTLTALSIEGSDPCRVSLKLDLRLISDETWTALGWKTG